MIECYHILDKHVTIKVDVIETGLYSYYEYTGPT